MRVHTVKTDRYRVIAAPVGSGEPVTARIELRYEKVCGTCEFFAPSGGDEANGSAWMCCAHPPIATGLGVTCFPSVLPHHWCGEWALSPDAEPLPEEKPE